MLFVPIVKKHILHLSSPRCGIPTVIRPLRKCKAKPCCTCLDLLLKCSNWVGLHNRLCWLCLHLLLLAEHHDCTRFCGRPGPSLDAANAWDGEDACLLDLVRGNSHKAVQDVGAILRFHFVLSRDPH